MVPGSPRPGAILLEARDGPVGPGGQGTRPACAPPTPRGSHRCPGPFPSERVRPACGRHPGPWRCHSPAAAGSCSCALVRQLSSGWDRNRVQTRDRRWPCLWKRVVVIDTPHRHHGVSVRNRRSVPRTQREAWLRCSVGPGRGPGPQEGRGWAGAGPWLLAALGAVPEQAGRPLAASPCPLPLTPLPFQVSKISLVDLAGSERADSTGAKGTRLKVGRAPAPPGPFPELGLLQGPVQGHERPAARGRPSGYARPSAAFPTEDTVARWQCGRLASVLRGHRLGPAVLGVRKAFASLRAWWGGRGPGSHRAARVRRCQDSRGAEETWGPLPAAAHASRAQHGRPRGWRWAGGTRGVLTSCPSPCRREPTSTSP